ncbi:MAG: hypothetical protein CR988_04525 [Treponema sp.]|nr:MAG: hypothetical protein CR988_04525 [Treponema sp.]
MKKLRFMFVLMMVFALLFTSCVSTGSSAKNNDVTVLEDTVYVGDRILDVSNSLGIMPKFAAARYGQWPKSKNFQTGRLGCPNRVTRKMKDVVPKLIAEKGVKKVVVEKATMPYCLLMKPVNPMDIIGIVKDKNVEITVIDFSKSNKNGIIEMAKYLGKEAEGVALADKYEKEMAKAEASMKDVKKGKKVAVLHTFVNPKTGRLFLFGESKGFYTDTIFLNKFGAKNVTDVLNKDKEELFKGNFTVTDLALLTEANPDVIIVYGSGAKNVKEKLAELKKQTPKFAEIPAIKNKAVAYDLPFYIGCDIEDAPKMIEKWVKFFKKVK